MSFTVNSLHLADSFFQDTKLKVEYMIQSIFFTWRKWSSTPCTKIRKSMNYVVPSLPVTIQSLWWVPCLNVLKDYWSLFIPPQKATASLKPSKPRTNKEAETIKSYMESNIFTGHLVQKRNLKLFGKESPHQRKLEFISFTLSSQIMERVFVQTQGRAY